MLEQDQAEAVAERIQAEEKAADILKEANDIKAKAKDDKDDFNKRAKAWVEREKVSIGKKHDQADRDRESAAADLLTAQSILDHLRTAYAAVRASPAPHTASAHLGPGDRTREEAGSDRQAASGLCVSCASEGH